MRSLNYLINWLLYFAVSSFSSQQISKLSCCKYMPCLQDLLNVKWHACWNDEKRFDSPEEEILSSVFFNSTSKTIKMTKVLIQVLFFVCKNQYHTAEYIRKLFSSRIPHSGAGTFAGYAKKIRHLFIGW